MKYVISILVEKDHALLKELKVYKDLRNQFKKENQINKCVESMISQYCEKISKIRSAIKILKRARDERA